MSHFRETTTAHAPRLVNLWSLLCALMHRVSLNKKLCIGEWNYFLKHDGAQGAEEKGQLEAMQMAESNRTQRKSFPAEPMPPARWF